MSKVIRRDFDAPGVPGHLVELAPDPDGVRCTSMAYITGDNLKRCVRSADHSATEPHAWFESLDVVGRSPMVAYWRDGAERADVYAVSQIETT
jgi:hypothetical protein